MGGNGVSKFLMKNMRTLLRKTLLGLNLCVILGTPNLAPNLAFKLRHHFKFSQLVFSVRGNFHWHWHWKYENLVVWSNGWNEFWQWYKDKTPPESTINYFHWSNSTKLRWGKCSYKRGEYLQVLVVPLYKHTSSKKNTPNVWQIWQFWTTLTILDKFENFWHFGQIW